MKVFDFLRKNLLEITRDCDSEIFCIRGVWDFDMRSNPVPKERVFRESGYLVASYGIGTSFRLDSRTPDLDSVIGYDGRILVADDRALEVAALDSCYAYVNPSPCLIHNLVGSSTHKASLRAKIVLDELERIVGTHSKVLMIGVVKTIVEEATSRGMSVLLSDFDLEVVGSTICDIQVRDGAENANLISKSDIVLVTGMTISTDTLDDLLEQANLHEVSTVIYAQTGSNFGAAYLKLGVTSVIGEHFPWYCIPGQSTIEIHRSEGG